MRRRDPATWSNGADLRWSLLRHPVDPFEMEGCRSHLSGAGPRPDVAPLHLLDQPGRPDERSSTIQRHPRRAESSNVSLPEGFPGHETRFPNLFQSALDVASAFGTARR